MKRHEMIQQLFRRFSGLKSQRDLYSNMWDDITEFVLPHRGDFAHKRTAAAKKDRRLFDSTAIRANEFLAATLKDGVMPIHDKWGRITTLNQNVNIIDEVAEYFDSINNIMYAALNNPNSNFHSQNHEMFLDLCAYGTACMYIDDDKAKGLRFKTIHLSEIFMAEDKNGNVDTVFRKFEYTPRQAAQQWGVENLSEGLQKTLMEKPDEKVEFLHCVKPNEDYDGTGITVTNLPWASYYCEMNEMHVLEESGYHEMPYKIPRWFKFVGETYGRSPAWGAMPDIMMVNNLKQLLIRASQKAADPVYLLADDGVILPLDTRPGGVNFGGIDPINGRPRVQTLPNDGRFDVTYKLLDGVQKDIRDAFYSDQLADRNTDRMTATAVTELKDEKLRLIGPSVGRIQTEFAGPLLQRVYGMLDRAGAFPKPSPEVAEILKKVSLDITFSAPLFNTERRQEPIALQRALQALEFFSQTDPNFRHNFDMREATKQVASVLGVPGKYMASDEQYDTKVQEETQRQQEAEEIAKQGAQAKAQADANKGDPTR